MHKLPKESVDVEAIATELARYLKMSSEDAEVLSQDPTRRDKLIAELYKHPGVKPSHHASQFVQPGGNPDDYLVPANAAIARLTPPKSFEDRIMRLHIVWPASMVFHQYKIVYALLDQPNLLEKVIMRNHQIMEEWLRTDFHVRFPPPSFGASLSTPLAPSPARAPTPDRSSDTPKKLTEDQTKDFISNPHTMIGKQFVYAPPHESEDSGTWEAISYTVKKADGGGVDCEYQVLLESFKPDALPMGRDEVQDLLKYSSLLETSVKLDSIFIEHERLGDGLNARPGGNPDDYLIPANAEIARLTPPKSFEDRIMRFHIVMPAMMVFEQYKVAYALLDLPDLSTKVDKRRYEIMEEWRRTYFHVHYPPRRRGYSNTTVSPPPVLSPASTSTLDASNDSSKQLTEDQSKDFLSKPHTMIGKQFVYAPPHESEDSGTWEVISYSVTKADDGGVDHEFQVLLESFKPDALPMGKDEVEDLLKYSSLLD
ncbi:hypothetical protein EIP91_008001 [Steccherinum ochraceum]|uniref:Uncharacterized protein n=1 Tax=Steccherinum ochraceum TaxID=92696 RepID=A0A4R0RHD3_9APHY|nr:hypothetical protein EIP91_008001 [Steccherinum ochraceum]